MAQDLFKRGQEPPNQMNDFLEKNFN